MKMYLIAGIVAVVIIAIVGFIYFSKTPTSTTTPTPSSTEPVSALTPSASPISTSSATPSGSPTASGSGTVGFCLPSALQAQVALEPAAGNIWGKVTIANIGKTACKILGGNSIQIGYDPAIKNIHVSLQGATTADSFTIAPTKSVYSQIHYPNGPQCQGTPVQKNITISYKISSTDVVSFRATDGTTTFSVPTCTDPSEITEIQTWPISATAVTP